MAKAYALDPLSDFMLYNFALDLLVDRPERALDELRRGLRAQPATRRRSC